MKQIIMAKLASKYSRLSKEFLGLIAKQIAKKATEELLAHISNNYDNVIILADYKPKEKAVKKKK